MSAEGLAAGAAQRNRGDGQCRAADVYGRCRQSVSDDYDERLVTTLVTLRELIALANDSKQSCVTAKREASTKVDGWHQSLSVSCPDNLPRICSTGPDGSRGTMDDICDDVRDFRRPSH